MKKKKYVCYEKKYVKKKLYWTFYFCLWGIIWYLKEIELKSVPSKNDINRLKFVLNLWEIWFRTVRKRRYLLWYQQLKITYKAKKSFGWSLELIKSPLYCLFIILIYFIEKILSARLWRDSCYRREPCLRYLYLFSMLLEDRYSIKRKVVSTINSFTEDTLLNSKPSLLQNNMYIEFWQVIFIENYKYHNKNYLKN